MSEEFIRTRPNRTLNLKNQRFGRLIALSLAAPDKNGKTRWNCICDCGNTAIVQTNCLQQGSTKSCGCLFMERARRGNSPGDSAMKKLYRTYKRNCAKSDRMFSISIQDFKILTKQNCYYCGSKPKYIIRGEGNGDYVYNGIDRIDSSRGYVKDNIVTACKDCNFAKQSMDRYDFLKMIRNIYNNLQLGGMRINE
jgi:hypothetical protein